MPLRKSWQREIDIPRRPAPGAAQLVMLRAGAEAAIFVISEAPAQETGRTRAAPRHGE